MANIARADELRGIIDSYFSSSAQAEKESSLVTLRVGMMMMMMMLAAPLLIGYIHNVLYEMCDSIFNTLSILVFKF